MSFGLEKRTNEELTDNFESDQFLFDDEVNKGNNTGDEHSNNGKIRSRESSSKE